MVKEKLKKDMVLEIEDLRLRLDEAEQALGAIRRGEVDALVVSTAHDAFKRPELYRGVRLVVDARNLVGPLFAPGAPPCRVVKA